MDRLVIRDLRELKLWESIGTCWVRHFDPWSIKEPFNIPGNIMPVAILDMGYPSEKGMPHPVHWKRRPLEETVVYESF